MANEVYANGMELACKAGAGKSICAFPDVCFTPPLTPATPPGVPVPYPNTGMASDTTNGTKTVKITGKEVMLKNKSFYKRSSGDEAGSAPKKGVVTSVNMGKVYFTSWSMDVKFEGENVDRHFDLTTHNHASQGPNTPPWPEIENVAAPPPSGNCSKNAQDEKDSCQDYKPYKEDGKDPCPGALHNPPGKLKGKAVEKFAKKAKKDAAKDPCVQARRCRLTPYNAPRDGINGCCPGQSPHHVIPKSSFFVGPVKGGTKLPGCGNYDPAKAPCICLEGTNNTAGTHGDGHQAHRRAGRLAGMEKGGLYPFSDHVAACTQAIEDIAPHCKSECLEDQVADQHKKAGVEGNPKVKHSPSGKTEITADKAKAVASKKAAQGTSGSP